MSITNDQATTIMRMARELETTGRLCSLSVSDHKDWMIKNREVDCALKDYLNSLTEVKWISSSYVIGPIDKIKYVYLAPGDWEVHFYDKVKEQHEKVRLAIDIQSVITTEKILIELGYSFDKIDKIYRTR